MAVLAVGGGWIAGVFVAEPVCRLAFVFDWFLWKIHSTKTRYFSLNLILCFKTVCVFEVGDVRALTRDTVSP